MRDSPTRGRDHLLALAARQREIDRAARELHPPLAELAVASVLRERPAPPALLVAAHLVAAERVEAFRRRAEELADRFDGGTVVVTGPLPPYSFVAPPAPDAPEPVPPAPNAPDPPAPAPDPPVPDPSRRA